MKSNLNYSNNEDSEYQSFSDPEYLREFLRIRRDTENKDDYIQKFNKWRKEQNKLHGDHRLNFNNWDLTNRYLKGIDLSNCSLKGVNLSDSNLNGAILTRADFENATIINASINDAILIKSNFFDAKINKTSFNNSDLRFTDLSYSKLKDAKFFDTNLQNAIINNSNLINSKFIKAKLNQASIRNSYLNHAEFNNETNLTDADLSNSELISVNFVNSLLTRANLSEVIANNAFFNKSELKHANLSNSHFNNAVFKDCDMEGCNLSRSFLKKAEILKVTLKDSDLSNTNLHDATVKDAILTNSRLEETYLATTATLKDIDWAYARFDSVQISYAQINRPIKSEKENRWPTAEDTYRRIKGNFEEIGAYRAAEKAYVKERKCRVRTKAPRWLRKYWPYYWRINPYDDYSKALRILPFYWETDPNMDGCKPNIIIWIFDFIPRILARYGTSLKLSISWLLFLLVFMASVFYFSGNLYNREECNICSTSSEILENSSDDCYPVKKLCPKEYDYIESLNFSLKSMLTMDHEYLSPKNELGSLLAGFEAFIAIIFAGLIGFTLGNWLRYS